jgi:galactokinase
MDTPLVTGKRANPGTEVLAEKKPGFEAFLRDLYSEDAPQARTRYAAVEKRFVSTFGDTPSVFVSTPGRVEIGGNHTDHNNGRVIAASVSLDLVGAAEKSGDNTITLFSEGYPAAFRVSLDQLQPVSDERVTTSALIRGIAARCAEAGYTIGGFRACVESQVKPGSGLSSSACIEMFIGTTLNALYNEGGIPVEELASIGQYAENVYFGKPCGLMDQLACGVGGIVAIDFGDPVHPAIHRIRRTLEESGLRLAVVHTGGSHADLTGDYAAIPKEMKAVAKALGGNVCRDIQSEEVLLKAIPDLRKTVGDRAVLRALHFIREVERVPEQVRSLEEGRIEEFLGHVNASGRSSAMVLQNSYPPKAPTEQGITLGLALTKNYLAKVGQGACRVHGGGFAGTILAILPGKAVDGYRTMMEQVFGEGSMCLLDIRSAGTAVFKVDHR